MGLLPSQASKDPVAFLGEALGVLACKEPTEEHRAIAAMAVKSGGIYAAVADPRRCSLNDAILIASVCSVADSCFDVKLIQQVWDSGSEDQNWYAVLRVLEIIDRTSDCTRLLPQLLKMLRAPHEKVRTKATLLIGRLKRDPEWIEPFLASGDPRMRSNAIETLWGESDAATLAVFRRVLRDPHHRVATTAAVGLWKAGDEQIAAWLEEMTCHADAAWIAAAAWAMGACEHRPFRAVLKKLAVSPVQGVRSAALRALVQINRRGGQ